MVTRALHDAGLHLIGEGASDLIDAAEDNPEGFWENKAIVAANDELLEAAGGSWDNPPDLPPLAIDDPRVAHVAEPASAAISALREHDRWGFKDPRTCLTASYWLDLVPDLRFIICVRHPLEVALSLKRRNQNSYSLGLSLWERYYTSVLELVPRERRIVTHYDTFFIDPDGEIDRLCAFAGLQAAEARVRDDLRHHTVGVSLAEAGVGEHLRGVYAELCAEAGHVLAPEPPSDEGRIRRLILDGTVAQRHADQRQQAIDRLQEREAALRDEQAVSESDLRDRIREQADIERGLREQLRQHELNSRQHISNLETKMAAERAGIEQLHIQTVETLQGLRVAVENTDSLMIALDGRTQENTRKLDRVVDLVEPGPIQVKARRITDKVSRIARRWGSRGRRSVTPLARAAVGQLPPRARARGRQARALARRGRTDPKGVARSVSRRAVPAARNAERRLPQSVQQQLRRGVRLARRGAADPVPAARAIVGRLPQPAQDLARRAWTASARLQNSRDQNRQRDSAAPKAVAAPKGAPLRQWKDDFRDMVAGTVPAGAPWLVVAPGSPKETRNVVSPRADLFPANRQGRPFADDLAHVANLEALRYSGHRHLVLPEGSRPWFHQQAVLRDHVSRTYLTVAEGDGGVVFDLSKPAGVETRSVRSEIQRLSRPLDQAPSVLDLTTGDVANEVPAAATFRAPSRAPLPYLDRSVDIVVIDDPAELDEALRVAELGVITVRASSAGFEVCDVTGGKHAAETSTPRILLCSSAGADAVAWERVLSERAAAAGADLLMLDFETDGLAALADIGRYDVMVVVEPGVLPLPGAIETAAALAVDQPHSAVTGKVVLPDGLLESAGGTVFFDRSVALIAAESPDVSAPWHDYVRPVCWAPGFVVASTALWTSTDLPDVRSERAMLREWCAAVWADGGSVVYRPHVASVRVVGNGREPSIPLEASAWQRVLDLRPPRPRDLNDGAWRYLLAREDVEACRG